ncbi:MAG: glutamyl-tRNA reductase [Candidatus Syntropharchaeia archaeon]
MSEIASMLVTHKNASIKDIERAWHGNVEKLNRLVASHELVEECVALSTCNRAELYVVSPDGKKVLSEFAEKAKVSRRIIEFHDHKRSLFHLLRLAAGLESMMIGEDQILGQIKDLFETAKRAGTVGKMLDLAFKKAIQVGKRVRSETNINKGAISIGSAAVELAEEILGSLDGKIILVIGAGEMATLVAKSLSSKNLNGIYVANRTFWRAEELAKELGGCAVKFDEIETYLPVSDVVISVTGAPHLIITKKMVERAMEKRKKKLLLIDIALPRDIDERVAEIPGVELHDIDGLRMISQRNLEKRKMEIEKVEQIIAEEFEKLLNEYRLFEADNILNKIYTRAEEIRERECARAIHMLRENNKDYEKVINDLTRSIVNKILADPTIAIKNAAKSEQSEVLATAAELFRVEEGENT